MKKIMTCLAAMAALVGCSKSDDNGGGISISEGTFPKKKLSTKQKMATLAMK